MAIILSFLLHGHNGNWHSRAKTLTFLLFFLQPNLLNSIFWRDGKNETLYAQLEKKYTLPILQELGFFFANYFRPTLPKTFILARIEILYLRRAFFGSRPMVEFGKIDASSLYFLVLYCIVVNINMSQYMYLILHYAENIDLNEY